MKGTKDDLIKYRIERAKDTYDDALILSKKSKWNSAINFEPVKQLISTIEIMIQENN